MKRIEKGRIKAEVSSEGSRDIIKRCLARDLFEFEL